MDKTSKILLAGAVLGGAYYWFVARPKRMTAVPVVTAGSPAYRTGHVGEDDEPCCEACARGEACSGVGACAWQPQEEPEPQTGGA